MVLSPRLASFGQIGPKYVFLRPMEANGGRETTFWTLPMAHMTFCTIFSHKKSCFVGGLSHIPTPLIKFILWISSNPFLIDEKFIGSL